MLCSDLKHDRYAMQLQYKLYSDFPNPNKIHSVAVIGNYIIAYSNKNERLYIWDITTWECKKIITPVSHVLQVAVSANDDIPLAK